MESTVILKLDVPGATKDQLQAGLRAAAAHFVKLDVHPMDAAAARFAAEGAMMSPDVECTDEQWAIVSVWDQAERIAFEACLGKDAAVPDGAYLELVDTDQPDDDEDGDVAD